MRKINLIIIHCTATLEGMDFKAKDIDKWHKQKGWKGIGYHYVIDLDGKIEKGRPEEEIGAHCVGKNKNSIGIVYVGGLNAKGQPCDTRTKEQKEALWELLRQLLVKYPKATIHGHNEFINKACPCFNVRESYNIINLRDNIN